jgi:hypothetical protein
MQLYQDEAFWASYSLLQQSIQRYFLLLLKMPAAALSADCL